MRKATVLAIMCIIGAGLTQGAVAAVIYTSAGPLAMNNGARPQLGAGNVNNAALGTDRTLVVEYDQAGREVNANGSWLGICFGHGTTLPAGFYDTLFQADTGGLVDTYARPGSSDTHSLWLNGTGTAWSTAPSDTTNAHVRYTLGLSPAGIVAGQSATATMQIDLDNSGSYDATLTGNFTWDGPNNYIYFASKGNNHTVTNIEVYSTPEPATLALLSLGGLALLRRRRR
jgi:hypothetical protein